MKRIVVILVTVLSSCFLVVSAGLSKGQPGISATGNHRGNLLFANSDFEQGTLHNWKATGTAFRYQPTYGDNPTARHRGQSAQNQGRFWIGTYERYQGKTSQRAGTIQGDRPTGRLESKPFTVSRERIAFVVGGGRDPRYQYVALVVGGQEVKRVTGANRETMKRVVWDVRSYAGQQAKIVIVDGSSKGWGHINADYFHYEGRETIDGDWPL